MRHTEFAVIEIGSHTVQLAVYRIDTNNSYRLMCEYDAKNRLRLVESLNAQSELPDFVIQALIDTVRQFKRYCQSARVDITNIDVVATSAIRDAANQQEIIAEVAAKTGLAIRVLSEPEEAALAADAVMQRTGTANGVIVDLGGGALRLARVVNGQTTASVSNALGTLRLRQRFEVRTDAQYEALDRMITQRLTGIPAALGVKHAPPRIAAIGGVVRALARMELARRGAAGDLREAVIEARQLKHWIQLLRTLSPVQVRALPGVPASRVDTVLIGAMVVSAVLDVFGAPALDIVDASIRDGLALQRARVFAHTVMAHA